VELGQQANRCRFCGSSELGAVTRVPTKAVNYLYGRRPDMRYVPAPLRLARRTAFMHTADFTRNEPQINRLLGAD